MKEFIIVYNSETGWYMTCEDANYVSVINGNTCKSFDTEKERTSKMVELGLEKAPIKKLQF